MLKSIKTMQMKNISSEKSNDYERKKAEARTFYSSFVKVVCPALGNEPVYFTSEGFNHLVYRGPKKERDQRVQIMKFELLGKAKKILEISTTFQEYEESFKYIRIQKYGKSVYNNVIFRMWGFVAMINIFRVKVVVKKVGNGKMEFYSVIPAWITRHYRDIKLIETSKGNLENEDDNEILKNTTNSGAL